MGMPYVTSFCWCLGLEGGTKLIGFLHLLFSVTLVGLASAFAHSARGQAGTAEDAGDAGDAASAGVYARAHAAATAVAAVSVGHVLLAVLLIVAAYKRNKRCLLAWVAVMCALLACSLLYILVSLTFGISSSGSDMFLSFLEGVVFFSFVIYCIICVNSYYLMLKSSDDMEGPQKD